MGPQEDAGGHGRMETDKQALVIWEANDQTPGWVWVKDGVH